MVGPEKRPAPDEVSSSAKRPRRSARAAARPSYAESDDDGDARGGGGADGDYEEPTDDADADSSAEQDRSGGHASVRLARCPVAPPQRRARAMGGGVGHH